MSKTAVISGGSGLVGRALTEKLIAHHFHVVILSRSNHPNEAHISYINWSKDGWTQQMPKADLIINLAGASLSKRWTKTYKKDILKSRLESTKKLHDYLEQSGDKPYFINASAVGYYPTAKRLTFTEKDVFTPHNFLSDVVCQWEEEACQIKALGIDTARCRFGVILSQQGGALPVMAKPYQFGAGGRIADGRQVLSWIHIDDLTEGILYSYNARLTGILNFTAPNPVTQNEFGRELGKALHRPHWTIVPKPVMNAILGDQAVMVTEGQRVLPARLLEAGFTFKYPDIQSALQEVYSR
ncbi:TIGR01777 family protein [Macrococcus equipercicus]|uniref:TIGR01777 family protein n=1 Tax=Macrococcus equipercicus TaxID=69967 RepID=A0ABQ6R8Y2_9STAP|nr:TIGR01777 family oxidoreductase [Macrococcus equipercicus]KAA1039605.1 TIGR01777 family protein [Macrococcus equipercicus]